MKKKINFEITRTPHEAIFNVLFSVWQPLAPCLWGFYTNLGFHICYYYYDGEDRGEPGSAVYMQNISETATLD